MLEDLRAGQDEITSLCDRLHAMLGAPVGPDAAALSTLRWKCVRQLTGHITFVRSFVLSPFTRDPDQTVRGAATRVAEAIARFDDEYRAHLARFDAFPAKADWDHYRRSSMGLVDTARKMIAIERSAINPLLARREAGTEASPVPVAGSGGPTQSLRA